jgi:hypothetical protein
MSRNLDQKNKDFELDTKIYNKIRDNISKNPFITIIAKYDQILGPRALYSSINLLDENFVRNLLKDALNTKNKFVIINFEHFYSQVLKIEVDDESARGRKQLYAVILLRDKEFPIIPNIHMKRIEMLFHKLDKSKILKDNLQVFEEFFNKIHGIYFKKDEILPLESINLQIRSGVNTIQGFCQLILEEKEKSGYLSEENLINYLSLILDSCEDIMDSLENNLSSYIK